MSADSIKLALAPGLIEMSTAADRSSVPVSILGGMGGAGESLADQQGQAPCGLHPGAIVYNPSPQRCCHARPTIWKSVPVRAASPEL